MMPPVKIFFSMFSNLRPILEMLQQHSGVAQSFGEPEIRELDKDGKKIFVVIEKTAFATKKDAEIFVEVGNRIHSMKL
jgi:hypothetical protein